MKKYGFYFLVFCLALLILDVVIPQRLAVSKSILIHANPVSVSRFISDSAKTSGIVNNPGYPAGINTKEGCLHPVPVRMIGSAFRPGKLDIRTSCRLINNRINFISSDHTSCIATWGFDFNLGTNIFEKIYFFPQYLRSREEMDSRLNFFKSYLENQGNLYGLVVAGQKVRDSLVFVFEKSLSTYPSPDEIYAPVALLQEYIARQGGRQINHPMLHVDSMGRGQYQMMVAIPTDIPVADSAGLKFRRLVAGNLLVAEVRGGPATISNAIIQVQNFMRDHQKSSPAIPYQSMVTNRLTEPDTSRWITRINYPVF